MTLACVKLTRTLARTQSSSRWGYAAGTLNISTDKEAEGRDCYLPLIYFLLFCSAQYPRPWEGAAHIQVGALDIFSGKSFIGTPQMCVSVTHWGFLMQST